MLKQSLSQKLLQKLSPQQIQLMKLIQLPTQALEERIKEELEENPALEEDGRQESDGLDEEWDRDPDAGEERESMDDFDPDPYLSDDEIPEYRLRANNYSSDDEERQVPLSGGKSFNEILLDQLQMRDLSEEDRRIAEYIIGNIDDDGYLRRDIVEILDDLAFTQNVFTTEDKLEELLKIVQDFDPPGVGARTLQECLLIQLRHKTQTSSVRLAIEILEEQYDEFVKKHFNKLIDRLETDTEHLKDALDEIYKLNPKPGGAEGGNKAITQAVIPDYILQISDGELELSLNSKNAPELNVSREYQTMLRNYKENKEKMSRSEKDALMFVKQKLDSAKWFIDAIKQRQQTLLLTMSAIMEFQKEYFLTGDERNLRPMILKDIADEIGMDISTVSRVASNKYVQTPYGTFLVKDFFSESMKNSEGEDVSTREIKKILEESIGEEDKRKPLTDDALAKLLKEKGYPIARRTVAKYREQLGVPVARLRKEL